MATYNFSLDPVIVPEVNTSNRIIKTSIPCEGTKGIIRRMCQCESRSMHGQMPIVWDKAHGYSIFDRMGNKWIDFTSTIFVTNIGHAHPYLSKALHSIIDKPLFHSYAYFNEKRLEYIEKLVKFASPPFEKAFLLSSGTESTEAALKLMRMYGQREGKKPGIICFEGNWHGRTMGAQQMSSNNPQKSWIGYLDPNIYFLPFPYPWVLKDINSKGLFLNSLKNLESTGINLNKDICGVMLETFQGWGAVFYPNEFVQEVENFCKSNNILMTFDEMQSGFARTGKAFGFEHYNVKPDLLCCGKGMGSGLPLSGVIGKADIMDLPETGNMSSTHSANPIVCTAGLATLEVIINENLINVSDKRGKLLHSLLNRIKLDFDHCINYILGKGMIAAIIFRDVNEKTSASLLASQICERCMQKGLLIVHTGRESIKIGPPLIISEDALIEGVEVIRESIQEILYEM